MLSHLVAVTGGLRTAVHGVALVDRRQHLQTETSAKAGKYFHLQLLLLHLCIAHISFLLVLADLLAKMLPTTLKLVRKCFSPSARFGAEPTLRPTVMNGVSSRCRVIRRE